MQRRQAIKLLSTLCASSLVLQRLPGQSRTSNGELTYGLFFDEKDLPRIRENFLTNPLFAEFREYLASFDKDGEYAFIKDQLRYNDQLFHIGRLGAAAEFMAFHYLMTGAEDSAELARHAIRQIMKFDRWDFFLDGDQGIAMQRASGSTVSVSLVIDFLGSNLSDRERREWLRTMGERGCEACYRTLHGIRNPQEVTGWRFDPESTFFEHRPDARTDMNRRPEITENTNLRAVPASALVIGTIAYQLEFGESETTRRWLEMGTYSTEVFRNFFEPDGSYDEEINYAYYTAEHLQQAVVILSRHGQSAPVDLINWDGYVDFNLNMAMPTHINPCSIVNFGDSGKRPPLPNKPVEVSPPLWLAAKSNFSQTALPLWIAARNRNGHARWYAENLGGASTLWSVIWSDPSVESKPPEDGPRLWVSDIDRVVARTGYGVDDLVVAMRSGPPANHEHADRNSIIVKCYGEQLVTDPLRPPYGFADPSWRMRLTEGHSAVLIDGHGHEHHNGVEGTNASRSFARITHNHDDKRHARWTSEATQPYRLVDLNIKQVLRTVFVLYNEPAVIVVDRFSKWKHASTLTSRFFGYNLDEALSLEVLPDGFIVRRPHAAMRATTYASVGFNVMQGKLAIAPDRAEENPFIDVVTAPSMEATVVNVLSIGRKASETGTAEFKSGTDGLVVSIGGSTVRLNGDKCTLL